MPSGKTNVSGSRERRGGEPAAIALPDDRRVQALLDRRPDRERGREVVALDDEVGAVAHADLVDLGEQLVGGVAGERRRRARARRRCRRARAGPPASQRRPPRTARRRASRRSPRRGARDGARRASSPCRGRWQPASNAAVEDRRVQARVAGVEDRRRPARRARARRSPPRSDASTACGGDAVGSPIAAARARARAPSTSASAICSKNVAAAGDRGDARRRRRPPRRRGCAWGARYRERSRRRRPAPHGRVGVRVPARRPR